MNLERIKKDLGRFGLRMYLFYILIRLVNKLTYFNVLVGMTLTPDSLDSKYLDCDEKYSSRFLEKDELLSYAKDESLDLPEDFILEALTAGSDCFAILDGENLASYGWYSKKPTIFDEPLYLHFDDSYVYMYRGYTPKEYRGQRLHAVGMAKAMMAYVDRGAKGLISYVESSNFNSLRSVYRMGYVPFGKVYVLKLFGKRLIWRTGACKKYSFGLR